MKKGDKVKIIDAGHLYTTYTPMYKKFGFKDVSNNYKNLPLENANDIFTVFAIDNHDQRSEITLCAIRNDSGLELLINAVGLKQIEPEQTAKFRTKAGFIGNYIINCYDDTLHKYMNLFCSNDPYFSGWYDKYAKQFGFLYAFECSVGYLTNSCDCIKIKDKELSFPRKMFVWNTDYPINPVKRIVVADLGEMCASNRFQAVEIGSEGSFRRNENWYSGGWKYASDTFPVAELTMDEIAEKFGIPIERLKIKK